MATWKKKNHSNHREKVNELIKLTETKIDSYVFDIEKLKEFHRFRNLMSERFSLRNCALIESQFRGAIQVNTYQQWQKEGYQVQGKEMALYVLTPVKYQRVIDKKGKVLNSLTKATKEQKEKIKSGELKVSEKLDFRRQAMFDITQTDAPLEVYPEHIQQFYLMGQSGKEKELYSSIEAFRNEINVGRYKERPTNVKNSSANGFYVPTEHSIWVSTKLPKDHFIKTNLHELAHAIMHKNSNLAPELKEYQAELTASVVASYFGLDSLEPASAYIKSHVQDMEVKDKENLITEVLEVSDNMILSMELHLEKEFGLRNDMDKEINDIAALEDFPIIKNELPNTIIDQLTSKEYPTQLKNENTIPENVWKREASVKGETKVLTNKLDSMLGKQQMLARGHAKEERTF